MPNRLYATAREPGFARVSIHPDHAGVRMPVADLIRGLAKRGAHHAVR